MPNEFSQTHQRLADSKLMEIVARADDYSPAAVTSAREELARRNLFQEDIDQYNALRSADKAKNKEQLNALKDKAESAIEAIGGIRHPEKEVDHSVTFKINAISATFLVSIISSLYQIIKLKFFLDPYYWEYQSFDFYLHCINIMLSTVTLYLWHKRKKAGWHLLAGITTLSIVIFPFLLGVNAWNTYQYKLKYQPVEGDLQEMIDQIVLPEPSYFKLDLFIYILLFGGLLWVITRPLLRSTYEISTAQVKNNLLASFFLGGICCIALSLILFN